MSIEFCKESCSWESSEIFALLFQPDARHSKYLWLSRKLQWSCFLPLDLSTISFRIFFFSFFVFWLLICGSRVQLQECTIELLPFCCFLKWQLNLFASCPSVCRGFWYVGHLLCRATPGLHTSFSTLPTISCLVLVHDRGKDAGFSTLPTISCPTSEPVCMVLVHDLGKGAKCNSQNWK